MLGRWETARQTGDSFINYSNVCLDGEKQQDRLAAESYSTEMSAGGKQRSKLKTVS